MRGFCKVHDDEGDGGGEASGQPLERWERRFCEVELEDCGDYQAYEAAEEVSED